MPDITDEHCKTAKFKNGHIAYLCFKCEVFPKPCCFYSWVYIYFLILVSSQSTVRRQCVVGFALRTGRALWSSNMAAVDFGDAELFDQFEEKAPTHIRMIDEGDEEEGESSDRLRGLRHTLEVCEETVERLKAENILIVFHPVSVLAFVFGWNIYCLTALLACWIWLYHCI